MKINTSKLVTRALLLRQRRTRSGHRQHERNGICFPGVAAAGHLEAGRRAPIPQGVHRVDDSLCDSDCQHTCDPDFGGEGEKGGKVVFVWLFIGTE